MKTLTVKLSEEVAARLEKRARRLGRTKSEVVRETLERELTRRMSVEEEPSMYDLTRKDCGCFDSGVTDLATHPRHLEGFGR